MSCPTLLSEREETTEVSKDRNNLLGAFLVGQATMEPFATDVEPHDVGTVDGHFYPWQIF